MASPARLQLSRISKRFGNNLVLKDISLELRGGGILGLVGQNGAGKSTLVKILAGLYPDYRGTVTIDGRQVHLQNPRQARAEGIAVIYQEFSLVPEMTVAENLLLGREPGNWHYSAKKVEERAEHVLESVGIQIGVPLSTPVSVLSPALKQRIEIAKALAEKASVLLMDEPTARLSKSETAWLFTTMRRLSEQENVGVIFISHFLEEVLEVTDWVVVLRNGAVEVSAPSGELSLDALTSAMLGEQLRSQLAHRRVAVEGQPRGEVLLEADGVCAGERLQEVSIQIRAGEVLGVAGLVGSGRSRLCRVLSGAEKATGGRLMLHGKQVRLKSPREAVKAGIALIPEDRKTQALSLVNSVKDNMVLMALDGELSSGPMVPLSRVRRLATRYVTQLEVSPTSLEAPAGTLSGGNQQKVVVGKSLAAKPSILIIDQPTAGVDVGTKAQLHELLRSLADAGAGLLVVSDDIDELFTLSDRLCVMRRGAITWEGPAELMDRQRLLQEVSRTSGSSIDPTPVQAG
jgi:ribose transport system ATP-binding protein